MAEAADTAPAQQQAARVATTTASDVSASAWLQQVLALLFPSNLAAKAALFALVVALLPLLPSGQAEAPRIWDLPHLLLLGIIISYAASSARRTPPTPRWPRRRERLPTTPSCCPASSTTRRRWRPTSRR
jgi:hypothetical protein